jgi:hypothetical protein
MSTPAAIGRYQVRERLGQGGMGVLYLALDPAIDRLVALKLLRVNQPEVRERFIREARLAARLQHPNIVTIFDVGEHDGQPFIAMEYIPGETLAELIARRAPLALIRRLEIVADACKGLAFAHKNGVVHRDVKPANLMISRDSGVLKVLDFGIARNVDSNLTQAGMLIGTPSYMSPEQLEGRPIDHRSDVFALGVVLYEVLVYRQAFAAETPHAVMHKVASTRPPSMLELNPSLDPELERIVDRAIEKRAVDRYPDLDRVRADLARVIQRLGAEQASATVVELPGLPSPPPPRSGVAERRAARIAAFLEQAGARLEAGDLVGAEDAAEQAEILDAEDPRVRSMLTRVRHAQERIEIAAWFTDAQAALRAGALTTAAELVSRVLQASPDHGEAISLRAAVHQALEARERAQERAHAVSRALEQGEEHLAAGALDAALRATSEALGFDPQASAALDLRERVQRAIAARIELTLTQARSDASAGRFATAIRALEAITPRDARVEAVEAEIRAAWQLAERRREAEDADRRARADAAQRREQANAHLQTARERAAVGDYTAALGLIDTALALDASRTDARELRDQWERDRAASQARREREARVSRALARARLQAEEGRHQEAIDGLDPLRDEPVVASLIATLRTTVAELGARARADAERQARDAHDRRVMAALGRAHELIADERTDEAIAALEAFTPTDDRIAATLVTLRRELRSRDEAARARETALASEAASQAQRDAEEGRLGAAISRLERFLPRHPVTDAALEQLRTLHERRAHDASARALTLAASGREAEAFALLREFDPPHPIVVDAQIRLRGESAAREARRLGEERARQRTADAAAQRDALAEWVASECARGRAALEREHFDEAARIAQGVLSRTLDASEAARILDEAVGAQAASEAAAARRVELARTIEQAAAALDAGDLERARARLDAAAAIGAAHGQLAVLGERLAAADAELEAARRLELHDRRARAAVDNARAMAAARQEDAALRRLERFEPPHPLVSAARDNLRADLEAREAQRQADLEARARAAVAAAEAAAAADLVSSDDLLPALVSDAAPGAAALPADAHAGSPPQTRVARTGASRRLLALAAIVLVVSGSVAIYLLRRETPVAGGGRSEGSARASNGEGDRARAPEKPTGSDASATTPKPGGPTIDVPVSTSTPQAALVPLVIDATPWAEITRIARIDTRDEIPLESERNTPYVAQLPPGAYEVTVRRFQSSQQRRVTVSGASDARVVFAFEPVDVDEYLRRVGS